ncbi:hypothetical protein D3C78_969310 [compost metagenome]
MALVDKLHQQQRRQIRGQLCLQLRQIPVQRGELVLGLGTLAHQGGYGQGRLVQPLPQIGIGFIEGDG